MTRKKASTEAEADEQSAAEETAEATEKAQVPDPLPTIGRIVHYQLTDQEAEEIERELKIGDGDCLSGGQYVAAIVVGTYGSLCHLKLQINGELRRDPRLTSRAFGDSPGTWCYPPRVG